MKFGVIISGYNDGSGWSLLWFTRQELMDIFGVDPAGCEGLVLKMPARYLTRYTHYQKRPKR